MNEYRGLEGEWHDLFWAEEEVNELALLENFIKKIEGSTLYIGSGSGRLLGPLQEQGYEVSGLEASEEMVALSEKQWPNAQVQMGRWENFEPQEKFAAIVVPAFTLQLLEAPQAALKKMRATVKEGGQLYVSLFFPWVELSGELPHGKWYDDREVELADGFKGQLQTRHKIDERKTTLKREHRYRVFDHDGKILKEEVTQQTIRWFADGSLERMFQNTGWKITKEVPNFGMQDDEDDLVYVITLYLEASA